MHEQTWVLGIRWNAAVGHRIFTADLVKERTESVAETHIRHCSILSYRISVSGAIGQKAEFCVLRASFGPSNTGRAQFECSEGAKAGTESIFVEM